MARRIKKLLFYADLIDGIRKPLSTIAPPPPEPPGNPDPGGDDGGSQNPGGETGGVDQGTGGDVGNPDTGSGVITAGNAPTITRKAHAQDIFVQQGTTLSITYKATEPGAWILKGGKAAMLTSFSPDGLEMTVNWLVPTNEPGDSTYVGAEYWVYGSATTNTFSRIWDRLHIGKTAADIVRGGKGTTHQVIQLAAEALLTTAGRTLIIADGTYDSDSDIFHVGYEDSRGQSAPSIANGINTATTSTDHAGVSFADYNVSKFTCIMAETPGGVILDRKGRNAGIRLNGDGVYPNAISGNSGRQTIGIHAIGFEVLNGAYRQAEMQKCFKTKITYSFVTQALTYPNAIGNTGWTGDGACTASMSAVGTIFENMGVIGHERLLNNSSRKTLRSMFRGVMTTAGAVQIRNETISQVFVAYDGQNVSWNNCYNLDGADFAAAVNYSGERINFFLNSAFVATNGSNNNVHGNSCLSLRDVRDSWFSNGSGVASGANDRIRNSTFWDRITLNVGGKYFQQTGPLVQGGRLTLDGVMVGKNAGHYGISGVNLDRGDGNNNQIKSLLIVSPTWNYGRGNDSIINTTNGKTSLVEHLGIFSDYPAPAATAATEIYVSETLATAHASRKYISRNEQGSVISTESIGSKDIFALCGEYGTFRDQSGHDTFFDGTSGNPYVNAISRGPWVEAQEKRRKYICTSNGVTVRGNTGWAAAGIHPVDYINRFGTTPDRPINTPYIDDIYAYLDANNNPVLAWRPVCAAYRSTIISYDIYIDRVRVAENVPKESTLYKFGNGVAAGVRLLQVIVKDSQYGPSGFSRPIFITVP